MGHQRTLLGGAEGTQGAGVGLLPSMGAHVLPQVFHLSCSEGAVRACERLFSSVNASVFLKVGDDGSLVRAEGTLVSLGGSLARGCHTPPLALCLWPHL